MSKEKPSLLEKIRGSACAPAGQAKALPFASYHDPSVYNLEVENVFYSDWVFVCAENELVNPGDYLAFFLADEPMIIMRGNDRRLRAMSNVCRHRGTLLKDPGRGNSTTLVCPYHAWTYDDAGVLLSAAHTEKGEVAQSEHCLPHFLLEVWNGLVFINLNLHASALAPRLSGIEKYLRIFDSRRFQKSYSSDCETWEANWKLVMENAMESYHLFKVHRATLEKVTPTKQAFYLEGSADWSVTAGKMEAGGNSMLNWIMGSEGKAYEHYVLISIPPCFVGIVTYDSFDWIGVMPQGSTRCRIRAGGINETGSPGNQDERDFVGAFFAEDRQICERVQSGMSARFSQGGQLVDMERIVVDFHHYLAQRLFSARTPGPYKSARAAQILNIE